MATPLFPKDPLLQQLVEQDPAIELTQERQPIYDSLLSSIISQQLSVKAAATIKQRFLALFPENNPKPELVLAASTEELRGVGLSGQKVNYVRSVAQQKLDGLLEDADIAHLPDEKLIQRLVAIKGIGRWSAEMILMFALQRLDVMAVDDLGIYNAMKRLYGWQETHKEAKQKMQAQAELWRPNRTLACRYLWQSLNNKPL
ncbi:DNA-3-methyladenine glycosylase 2 family protein [Nibribacter ruber]|uniref:DNA-3-methyladenine glycosylase II n=1 Tax=Nibribacter ruber TaxID=2698458 RepID=A0A6P1NXI0_9BACT|nr:DNA-3-methyladenine glycosylase 2 family protein [Nibribacter ruber]QHL86555.1 DNA-3-methyladenine glycosylase 2 family protein [Nibribacter ruber]